PGALSTTGSFAAITWGSGNKYLQVEMDPTGGTAYTNMGTQQLVSVPYSQYANTAGTLKIPFNATDSLATVMFTIENKNSTAILATSGEGSGVSGVSQNGAGLFGYSYSPVSAAIFGVNTSGGQGVRGISQLNHGISGESQSANFAGVYGYNNSGDGVSAISYSPSHSRVKAYNGGGGNAIDATATSGMGVYGYSNTNSAVFGANNSTSQSAVGGYNYNSGAGVTGYSQTGIGVVGNNGTAAWPAIQGTNNLGVGVKGVSASSAAAVEGINSGTGTGVKGTGTSGNGVSGNATTGIGVYAFSDNNRAVSANTNLGTALYGNSSFGNALETVGKIKLGGTGTTPAQGKVLTCDANGNATWEGAVAFSTTSLSSTSVPSGLAGTVVPFSGENYDLGSNYNPATRKFTAPTNGIYHFDVQIHWDF